MDHLCAGALDDAPHDIDCGVVPVEQAGGGDEPQGNGGSWLAEAADGADPGQAFGQGKSVPLIAMAHNIPYVATASVCALHDLEAKVTRAMEIRGARYIHVHVPCPLGWGSEPADTIKVARLAVECGLFPLMEARDGEVTDRTRIRHLVPVDDYLVLQKRFAHLFRPERDEPRLRMIQAIANGNIRRFGL